ncbi:unnamed protein product, partial [Musa acuminata var. zebrina]
IHKFNKLKKLLNFLLLILSCMKILELGFPRELYHMGSLELENFTCQELELSFSFGLWLTQLQQLSCMFLEVS